MKIKHLVYTASALIALGTAPTAHAMLRVWSGLASMDNKWSNVANWESGLPVAGDDLQFPLGALHPNNSDDYSNGFTFNSITFVYGGGGGAGGYNLSGNSIALNAGISAVNNSTSGFDDTVNNALLLNSNQTFSVNGTSDFLFLKGPINLNGRDLTFDVASTSQAQAEGVISGAGALIKTNPGTLLLSSNNTYTGSTTLNGGTLEIDGSQPASPILLSSGTLTGKGTVGTITSIGGGGPGSIVLDPRGNVNILTCSNVSLNAATTFTAAINGGGAGVYNQLNVHGSVALNNATLAVSLGFTPAVGNSFLIINNDGADAVSGTFNGLSEGSSFTVGTTRFGISYTGGDGNDVVLTVTGVAHTWSGGGMNTLWTNPANWTGNAAPTPGSDLIFPLGAAQLSSANDFPAGTLFNSITISGTNYSLTGSNILLNAGLDATNTTAPNYCYLPLTLNSDQAITTGNAGVNLYLFGDIDTSNKSLTIAGDGNTQLASVLRGSGGLMKTGNGLALLYGSNTFSGPVQILQGQMYIYHGYELGDTNGSTTIAGGATLVLVNAITVPEALVLSGTLFGNDPLQVWAGPVDLAGPEATITAGSGASLTINAPISGTNGFTKAGAGFLTLDSNNTYTGTTVINGGILFVNGSQPASPIVLAAGELRGSGTVGNITVSSPSLKTLWPGDDSPGILNSSNVTLDSSTTFSVQLNGTTAGGGYGQLNVSGTIALGNASLTVILGYTPALGDRFVIINNPGNDAVNGTFYGLPEGTTFTVGGALFSVIYDGGDGNDVVIYRGYPPARLTGINTVSNHLPQIQGLGLSNLTYTIQAATNLTPIINWTNVGSAPANGSGIFSFIDTNAALFPKRFYRAVSP
jgi:fibronectin-binding autotransporter adhesin